MGGPGGLNKWNVATCVCVRGKENCRGWSVENKGNLQGKSFRGYARRNRRAQKWLPLVAHGLKLFWQCGLGGEWGVAGNVKLGEKCNPQSPIGGDC